MINAALFEDRNATGIGSLARDHTGNLIRAKTRLFHEVMHPSMAEAVAVKKALSWLKEIKWGDVIVESDYLVVVQSIRSSVRMRSRLR